MPLDRGTDVGVANDYFGNLRPRGLGYDIGYAESAYTLYALTVATAGTGSGAVTPTLGITAYNYGTVVTLTATANPGSVFVGWSGACSGTGPCTVTMTSAQNVTALFENTQHKRYLPFVMKLP